VRYADDAVLGFEHRVEAERFLEQLRESLRKFGLELHPEKTRLIEFGRFAAERRKQRGEGKPETFNLGFTHIGGTNYRTGHFTVHRKTMGKRLAAKLKEIRAQLQRRMHTALPQTLEWLQQVVRGYFQYHAVPGNGARLRTFRREVLHHWYQALRRRSQRSRLRWSTPDFSLVCGPVAVGTAVTRWPPQKREALDRRALLSRADAMSSVAARSFGVSASVSEAIAETFPIDLVPVSNQIS